MLVNDRITSAHIFRDRVIRDKRYKAYIDTTGQIYEIIDLKKDPDELINLLESDIPEIQDAKRKFQAVLDDLPKKDASPIYQQLDTSYYDHPAEALNKVARGGKNGPAKSKPVSEEEYREFLEKQSKK